ncbi:hypothetical protein GCM10023340_26330 [Nocardioides marinquilinus]|uniref:VOC domain-containing protein n=1 Tax=Nocardioides marinquilinus TaxID=1210400 RepID=A0ABP9PPI1_9ACTN
MSDDTPLPVSALLAAVPVRDADAAREFYERLLGTPPSEAPMPGLTQWDVAGGVLQVVVDADRAGGGLLTLVVEDVGSAAAALRARGLEVDVATGEVVTALTQLLDPDGNAITLVQA